MIRKALLVRRKQVDVRFHQYTLGSRCSHGTHRGNRPQNELATRQWSDHAAHPSSPSLDFGQEYTGTDQRSRLRAWILRIALPATPVLASGADTAALVLLQSQLDRLHPTCVPKPLMLTAPFLQPVLSVRGLRKTYGNNFVAVDDLWFEVASNEIVGLLGPNGAGKTTTINMVLGVLEPTAGEIAIAGVDLRRDRSAALGCTNFAAVYAQLPGNLTVYENLRVFGMIYGVEHLATRIDEVIREFDLARLRHTKCGVLSSGEQTRVSLAKALLNRPRLLLLDEPTASLDPSTARDVRAYIQAFAARGSGGVLWTSHNMYEVQEVCHRVLFLSRGKILLEGDPRRLPEEHGKGSLEELFIAVAREPLSLETGKS